VKITTNNHWHEFKNRHQVDPKVLRDEFDWCDEYSGFFQYLGFWYHTSQFMRMPNSEWDGSHADSAFTGVLIKLSSDGELYQVGSCRS